MLNHSWFDALKSRFTRTPIRHKRRATGQKGPTSSRLRLEVLEDRRLLAFLAPVDYAAGSSPYEAKAGDFNSDGHLDLTTANYSGNTVSVLLGNADGTFQPAQTAATGAGPVSVAVGDFNKDGNLDMATANAHDVSVLLGNGNGAFQAQSNINIGSDPTSMSVGDFNGDGLLDLGVTSNIYYPGVSLDPGSYEGIANVLLGNGKGSFSGPNVTTWTDWDYYDSAVAADLNGDGFDDFVTVNTDQSYISVLLGDSSGYLQGPSNFTTGYDVRSVGAGDLNADGNIDLVAANYDGKNVSVLLGDGFGSFTSGGNYATGDYPVWIVLGDFTGDGKVDVATANIRSASLSVLYGEGDGTLSPAVNFAVGSYPYGVAAGDFNSDGWLDAAVANSGGNDVSVLINDGSWATSPPPSVSVNDVMVTEGNTGTTTASFTLTLTYPSKVDVTVHYATANITAAAGSDYVGTAEDVIIPAGQTSATFIVAIKGDRLAEPTETFAINLSAATNATIGDGQGVGAILDNEPRISISDVIKAEGKKNQSTLFTFTVTLSAAYDQAVTMSFRTVDGSAKTTDQDYVARTGTLTFAPGETTKTITIEVKGDSKKEANEVFYLDLFGNSSNSLFNKNFASATILNDDGVSVPSNQLSSASAVDAALAEFVSVGSKKHGR